jgi:HNH endonuclease
VEEIRSIIDDPSNGMTLESNAHFGFDDFRWSLRAVEGVSNYYEIIIPPSAWNPTNLSGPEHIQDHLSCGGTRTPPTAQGRDYFRGF